jgi:ATP-dependent DNA helicase PIF1
MELSQAQHDAFVKYQEGKNLFVTGPGGSGKSALLRKIHDDALGRGKTIHVTALTGCAAVLLNCKAKTLHSWAGIGLGNAPVDQLVSKIRKKKFTKMVWCDTDILIVDEVSMLSLKLFETLNAVGRAVRRDPRPFGGIQVLFSGDFFQLPPVGDNDEPDTQRFCFESSQWVDVFPAGSQIPLTKIFRQTDEVYAGILNEIRVGNLTYPSYQTLLKYVGRQMAEDLVAEPTKLYPTRNMVDQINATKMQQLAGETRTFSVQYLLDLEMSKADKVLRAEFSDKDIQAELDYLSRGLICDKEMVIKVGSQVMCVVNVQSAEGSMELCNGSQGVVLGFCPLTGFPRVRFNNGVERVMSGHTWASENIPGIGVSQVPLILAWALTIHKSQGATMDAAEINIGSGIFECGQTYVALSRVKSLEGLYLTSFDPKKIKINKKVREFYNSL